MLTTTPSSTYSSIIPSYSSSNLTELHTTHTVHSYCEIDRHDIIKHMINNLTPNLFGFMDVRRDYSGSNDTYVYCGRIKVAPLSTKSTVLNDLYTLDTLPFTASEINTALRHTYPERFI